MLIRVKRGWELPESAATPESVFRDRRRLMKAVATGSILLTAGATLGACSAEAEVEQDPSALLYPVERNPRYKVDRPMTPEELVTNYNNFYEFGTSKDKIGSAPSELQ